MKCLRHKSYAHCPDCGAEYNIPAGFVLVKEVDLKLLNAAAAWAEHLPDRSLPG